MVEPKIDDWVIYQGRTFKKVIRWETEPIVYKQITNIENTAPIRLKVPSHGLKSGWYVAITDVQGMTEVNAQSNSPRATDYHQVTVEDADTITINAIDAASFSTYKSGGYIRYYTPVDLVNVEARVNIRSRVGGTLLANWSSTTGEIVVDDNSKVITIVVDDSITKNFTFTKAVYDLEAETALGEVIVLTVGDVTVIKEITVE